MRYELMNRYYGIKKIAPSEKAKDHILANCKKDPKDNKPVWQVTKELPDVDTPSREGELLAALEQAKAEIEALKSNTEKTPTPKKKMGQKSSSIKG